MTTLLVLCVAHATPVQAHRKAETVRQIVRTVPRVFEGSLPPLTGLQWACRK